MAATIDGDLVAERLVRGADDAAASRVDTHDYELDPEAQLLVVVADRSTFDEPTAFAAVALERLVAARDLDRRLLVGSVREARWLSLSEEQLSAVFRHIDFEFPLDVAAVVHETFDDGWTLHDSWDMQSVVYRTSDHLVAVFWATFV